MSFYPDQWRRQFYLDGFAGKKPAIPTRFDLLEQRAKDKLPEAAWCYISGGAGPGTSMDENLKCFRQVQILPKMLQNVERRSIETSLFGSTISAPVLTAPIGVLELAHPEADLAVAKATSEIGIPMIFSSQSSYSMEDITGCMGESPRWFQLYWSKSDDLTESFVRRAEACGCSAIVITLDTHVLGWRPQDLDIGYLPFLEAKGIAQYTSDPIFQEMMDDVDVNAQAGLGGSSFARLKGFIKMIRTYKGDGSFLELFRSKRPVAAVRKFIEIFSNSSLTWEDLKKVREMTSLPIVLKGILRVDDAIKAVEFGMDGIIVSNHGGRQVGGSISTIGALPGIIDAIGDQIPVLLDSGIREGADIFKALALGAHAVCIGRPYVYGLSIDGYTGVSAVLKNLITEFEITMGLCGCKDLSEITREMVQIQSL